MSVFRKTIDYQLMANILLQVADQGPFSLPWGFWMLKSIACFCVYGKNAYGPASFGLEPESDRIRSMLKDEGFRELGFAIRQEPKSGGYTYVVLVAADGKDSFRVRAVRTDAMAETMQWLMGDAPFSCDLPAASGSSTPSVALPQGNVRQVGRKPRKAVDWQLIATVLADLAREDADFADIYAVLYFSDADFVCVVSCNTYDSLERGHEREVEELRDLLGEQGIAELAFAEHAIPEEGNDFAYVMLLDAGDDKVLIAWAALTMAQWRSRVDD
jgi:hypothetical protein